MPEHGHADEKHTVAVNLAKLIEYAVDHPERGWPSSIKGLETRIKALVEHGARIRLVVRGTIQRALKEKAAIGVDTLAALARPYGLEAWQLLVPDLDPETAPMLLGREATKALIKSLNTVAVKNEAKTGGEDAEAQRKAAGADRHRAGAKARKVHRSEPAPSVRQARHPKAEKR